MGRDCVGAIQLVPEGWGIGDIRRVVAEPLTAAQIAAILRNYAGAPLGMTEDDDFRISIAGAQEKTALLYRDGQWLRPLGATPTSHIFKLRIWQIANGRIDMGDSVENEWLCHLILKAFSIPVADADIGVFEDTKALIVRRFDRRWSEDSSWLIRLPQEDMCQALNVPPSLKYENRGGPGISSVMALLLGSDNAVGDRYFFSKPRYCSGCWRQLTAAPRTSAHVQIFYCCNHDWLCRDMERRYG